ncbi:MAG: methyltransferase domain-containing protein [Candidatus Hodarchaeota archaeon]
MVFLKHSKLISKIKCPFCNKGLIYHEIDSGHKDGILFHANPFSKDCDMIFPVINEIIILTDYKFWPIIPFNSYLIRNKKKLPDKYLNSFLQIQKKINDKSYNFSSEIEKQQFEQIKFQQDFFKINKIQYKNWLYCYFLNYNNKLLIRRLNKFVSEYHFINHCKKEKIISGDWLLSICSGPGKDILALNIYLNQFGIKIKNVLNDIRFMALMKAKIIMKQFESYFVFGNSQTPPFYDNTFDICYVHNGLHHLPNPSNALVNLGKLSSRLLFITEAQKNRILKFLNLQHEEAGGIEYRFSKKEINTLLNPNFKNIKIYTSFLYNTPKLQRFFKKLNFFLFYISFRIAFTITKTIIGRFGNLLQISAQKRL